MRWKTKWLVLYKYNMFSQLSPVMLDKITTPSEPRSTMPLCTGWMADFHRLEG